MSLRSVYEREMPSVHWKALKRSTLATLAVHCAHREDLHEQYDQLGPHCDAPVRFKVWDSEGSEESPTYLCGPHGGNKKGWHFEGVE